MVCNPQARLAYMLVRHVKSQSPYGAKWFATPSYRTWDYAARFLGSQSPYGAKWFATRGEEEEGDLEGRVAIPLRG